LHCDYFSSLNTERIFEKWTRESFITQQKTSKDKDISNRQQIYDDNDQCWHEVIAIDQITLRNHESLRQIFRRIAKNYEYLHDLGDYKYPIDTIATTMVKVLVKFGLYE
jgi:hypothetical protein